MTFLWSCMFAKKCWLSFCFVNACISWQFFYYINSIHILTEIPITRSGIVLMFNYSSFASIKLQHSFFFMFLGLFTGIPGSAGKSRPLARQMFYLHETLLSHTQLAQLILVFIVCNQAYSFTVVFVLIGYVARTLGEW